jgi:hypothetical protein
MGVGERAHARRSTAVLGGVALAAILVALLATRWGPGIAPDSVVYIGAARNLLDGRDLTLPFGGVEDAPNAEIEVHKHAPFFPLLLASIGLLGVDPLDGARWLNVLLFGANTFLVGYAVSQHTRSLPAAIVAGLLTLSSVDMLRVHTTALSEPLFILFELATFVLLASLIQRRQSLVLASGVIGLALFTRYPGIALAITGLTAVLFLTRADHSAKVRDSLFLLVGSSLPLLLWLVRSSFVGRNPIGRDIVFRPIGYRHIEPALNAFSSWLVPERLPGLPSFARPLLLCGVIALVLTIIVLSWWGRKGARRDSGPHGLEVLPTVTLVFVGAYTLVLGLSLVSIPDLWLRPDVGGRMQSPVFVALLVASLCAGYSAFQSKGAPRLLRPAIVVLCAFLLGTYAVRGTAFVARRYDQGSGYLNKPWRESETIAWIKTLPPSVELYSNGPDAIYFLTGRSTASIPWRIDKVTGSVTRSSSSRLDQMAARLRGGNAYLVLFTAIDWRGYFLSERELTELLPLALLDRKSDGAVYEIR